MGYGAPLTGFSANTAAAETTLLPPYNSVAIDSFPKALGAMPASASASTGVVMKSDSGISYNLPIPRKRGRDHSTINRFLSYPSSHAHSQKNCGRNFYFLGEDISILVQQQQLDLERLISQHQMEKVRMEMEEKRKREARRIMEAIEVGMMGILRSKEEEIEKMGKLNWELEERVNSLCMENQIWRDVAETNEATANALRSDLELVLLDVKKEEEVEEEEKAESCCGSNGGDMEEEEEEEVEEERRKGRKTRRKEKEEEDRRCKNCWKEESCVLLLPCRHLCLCTVCGSSLHHCPICNSTNNASVRVIMP
ncbi:probable BOI-related E3 ubiquitin-protein ligase 2 isoform X1 [Cucurbita maxima]|uniref:Probable BOI-related E3 ubiquitin-protein ligase 2 isoform X1 n=1 Tax=Cucurbita maxima TaxID=3661 RepID=A0A6J1JF86_CUCMA|nr:probable BOI-related E3 ubiquitin-protein ligase 2 isoform X1 [Cucurbita maxima]XP_022986009.1 probable BOI-related E3 ubiquitin-protein ligase 2 isoform X1 [Cucurbita maxima]